MIKGSEHILIVKLSSIGDVVHTIPFVEVLKSNYPEIKIDWCMDRQVYSIVEDNPGINRIIISNRREWKRDLAYPSRWHWITKDIRHFVKELHKYRYDMVIDLQGLLKSGIITAICEADRKIGLDGAREFAWLFVKETVSVNYDQHAIDRYLQVAEYLGCSSLDWRWKLHISDREKQKMDELISEINHNKLPIVAINPCSRWKTKLWPVKRFSELTRRLLEMGVKPLFLGGIRDRRLIGRILNGLEDGLEGAVNLAGLLSLKQIAYLYSRSNAVVSVDTGPMHIAVMAGAKVVALFGPTDPKRTGPYGEGHEIIRADLPCSPCLKKECAHVSCMKEIKVDKVLDSVIKILDQEMIR